MELKIFEAGFSEKEFNDFINSNITLKMTFNADGKGACYVFFMLPTKLGRTKIARIEQMNGAVESAEDKILTATLDNRGEVARLEEIKEKIKGISPNNKQQWDMIQTARIQCENQIKMHNDTITTLSNQVAVIRAEHQELLKNKDE